MRVKYIRASGQWGSRVWGQDETSLYSSTFVLLGEQSQQ